MHSKNRFCSKKEIMSESTYHRRKGQGICVRCGKKPARDGKCMCVECAEASKEYTNKSREFFRKQGLCPRCGKNKLFGDEKNCPECLAKCVKVTLKSDAKRIDKVKSYRKEYYQRKKKQLEEDHLCEDCWKRRRVDGHIYCSICLAKRRERKKQKEREKRQDFLERSERPAYGLCYCCGKQLDRDGKLCKVCAERVSRNLPEKRGGNYCWRLDNQIAFNKKGAVKC